MKKIQTLFFCFTLIISTAVAQLPLIERDQNPPKDRFIDHMFFGGVMGLQFGDITYVEIAPIIGYNISQRFSAGLGLKYIYYKESNGPYSYSTNQYGGGPFARYFIFDGLFAHAEYEILNMEVADPPYYSYLHRENVSSIFLGGGYRQMIGNRSSIDFLILWNVNENQYSPYTNPIFRLGFGFGI